MKIKRQFSLITAVIIVSLIALSAIFFIMYEQFSTLNMVNNEIRKMLLEFGKMSESVNYLLYGYDIDAHFKNYKDDYVKFRKNYSEFLTNPQILKMTRISGDFKNRFNRAGGILNYCDVKIVQIEESYNKLSNRTDKGFYVELYINQRSDYSIVEQQTFELYYLFRNSAEMTFYPIITYIEDYNKELSAVIRNIFIVLIIFILITVIAGSSLIFNRMTKRINEQLKILLNITNGNFTEHLALKGNNEISMISSYINSFIDNFKSLITEVIEMSRQISSIKDDVHNITRSSKDEIINLSQNFEFITKTVDLFDKNIGKSVNEIASINDSVGDLAKSMDSQSLLLTKSAVSISQMTIDIKRVAVNAKDKSGLMAGLLEIIKNGGQKIHLTNDIVSEVVSYIKNISKIIKMINDIAGKSNLLAMNAAIEAAHAGEMGSGFTVVAEEIRNLALLTNENSKKVRDMLTLIINKSKYAGDLSNESNEAFDLIRTEVSGFIRSFEEISSTMNDLNKSSEAINDSTLNLTEINQSVFDKTVDIKKRADIIGENINKIEDISTNIKSKVNELNDFLKQIVVTLDKLGILNDSCYGNIEKLDEKINHFTI